MGMHHAPTPNIGFSKVSVKVSLLSWQRGIEVVCRAFSGEIAKLQKKTY